MKKYLFVFIIFFNFLLANQIPSVLIPLYSHPTKWQSFDKYFKILSQNKIPTYLIINPNNGPGQAMDEFYIQGIKYLKNLGFHIIGYVHTEYGKRNPYEIKSDIYNWSDFYEIDGIFFDETDTQLISFNFYKDLISYSKTQDFNFNILNAGYTTNKKYIDSKIANIVITYENSYESFFKEFPSQTNSSNDFTKLSILLHSVKNNDFETLLSKVKSLDFQYIYFTEDTFPNPWDDLSSSFINSISK